MKQLLLGTLVVAVLFGLWFALRGAHEFTPPTTFPILDAAEVGSTTESDPGIATFGSGCFWCTEAVFQRVKGVKTVVSGYSGGTVPSPTYEQICRGDTGHVEVIQVTYDTKLVSYSELLEVFWRSHDPTTRDRQGNDEGPQYRSAIFYHSDRQRELAELYKQKIDMAGVFRAPIVTEIEPFTAFFPAGAEHQNYYNRNSKQPYCRTVIGHKLDALKAVFGERLMVGEK